MTAVIRLTRFSRLIATQTPNRRIRGPGQRHSAEHEYCGDKQTGNKISPPR